MHTYELDYLQHYTAPRPPPNTHRNELHCYGKINRIKLKAHSALNEGYRLRCLYDIRRSTLKLSDVT